METQAVKQFAKGFIAKGETASAVRKQIISDIGDAALDGLTSGSLKGVGISAAAGGIVGAISDDESAGKGFVKGAITGASVYAGAKAAQGMYWNREVLASDANDIRIIADNIAKTAPGDASTAAEAIKIKMPSNRSYMAGNRNGASVKEMTDQYFEDQFDFMTQYAEDILRRNGKL